MHLGQAPPLVPLTLVGEQTVLMFHFMGWHEAVQCPLDAKSAQAMLALKGVQELAEQAGLPYLCEYIVDKHIVFTPTSKRRWYYWR